MQDLHMIITSISNGIINIYIKLAQCHSASHKQTRFKDIHLTKEKQNEKRIAINLKK